MATCRPFRARRFRTEAAEPLHCLVAPPYDVITPADREALLRASPHNIVRLTLGGVDSNDPNKARYRGAAGAFGRWVWRGLLPADATPSYYVCEQSFALPDGSRHTRRGLTCLLRLEEFDTGVVAPHEHTYAEPKEDRLRLLQACRASFSDIFMLLSDPECELDALMGQATQSDPSAECNWGEDQTHRLWHVADETLCSALSAVLAPHRLVIADGHHRYETALSYRDLKRAECGHANGPWEWVNVFIANTETPGTVILPCHRLVPRSLCTPAQLCAAVERWFDVEELSVDPDAFHLAGPEAIRPRDRETHVLGFYGERGRLLRLSARDAQRIRRLTSDSHSDTWRALDVSVLHGAVLGDLLRVPAEQIAERVEPTGDLLRAADAVHRGEQALFLLNPPRSGDVVSVALGGERLPHKATYFYPKLLAGLVIRDMNVD